MLSLQLAGAALVTIGAAPAQALEICGTGVARGVTCIDAVVIATPHERDAVQLLAAVQTDGPRAVTRSLLPAPKTLEARSIAAEPAGRDAAPAPAGSDPSLAALFAAALGVVGFVAHRRSGR